MPYTEDDLKSLSIESQLNEQLPAGTKFLKTLAGMMGAVEEGKAQKQKTIMEEQDFYNTLRKNGYSASQAFDAVANQKTMRQAGIPNDGADYDAVEKQEKLKQAKAKTRQEELSVDKAEAEKSRGYKPVESDLTPNLADENRRNKSSVIELLRTGQYFDAKTGKFNRVKSREQMVSYLVDKFPGKVDYNDPDVKAAIDERFPKPSERQNILSKLFETKKAEAAPAEVMIRAKKTGRKFKATKEKAAQAIQSGLFEAA